MNTVINRPSAKKKASAHEKTVDSSVADKRAAQVRPDRRQSFGAIYMSDKFTMESAIKAFLKS